MTYKSIIQILLILAIISTVCISIMKPKMHPPVIVYNSEFSVFHDDGINIDEQNLPVMVQNSELSQEKGNTVAVYQANVDIDQVSIPSQNPVQVSFNDSQAKTQNINLIPTKTNNLKNTNIKNNTANVNLQPTKATTNKITSIKNNVSNTSTTKNNDLKIDLNKIVNNNQKIINQPTETKSTSVKTVSNAGTTQNPVVPTSTVKTEPKQTVNANSQATQPTIRLNNQVSSEPVKMASKTDTTPVILTAQEEEIAWNKWRSFLNNQIMKDSKLPTMPNGIVFKYKFTVDKYGKVSNVQTSSTTPSYTPYAIQFIAPVIRSYQGKSILNFPTGSNRVTTEVSGAWKISNTSKYSTPSDYNDVEKVKR